MASQARAAKPRVFKKCITAESLQRGIKMDDDKEARACQQTVVSSTASVMDMTMECKSPRRNASGRIHFESAGPEAIAGTIDMSIGDGAQTMTMHRVIQGKWTGNDCGSVKSDSD